MKIQTTILATALLGCGMIVPLQASSSTTANQAELRLSSTGQVRVTHEDLLAQGLDWTGTPVSAIKLSRGANVAPIRYEGPALFGPGSVVSFFGQAVSSSAYTSTAVYRLSVDAAGVGSPRLPTTTIGRKNCRNHGGTLDLFVHDPNRGYDMSSPHSSPWYAQRLVRNNVALVGSDEYFTLVDKTAGTTGDRITVGLWGGMNNPAVNPDHSVRLLLNGAVIASRQFDGFSYQSISVALAPDALRNGVNTLQVELVGDTGASVDVVYLDDIQVQYTRNLTAVDNRLDFANFSATTASTNNSSSNNGNGNNNGNGGGGSCNGNSSCSKYLVSGLTGSNIHVFRTSQDGTVNAVSDINVNADGAGFEACFAVADSTGDRYWVGPTQASVPVVITRKAAVFDPLAGPPASYLIVSHGDFVDGLSPLVAARLQDGHSVRVIEVGSIYDYYSQGSVDPDAIGTAISDAYQRLGTRYVLLVGGDTYDPLNFLGADSRTFLPSYYLPNSTIVRFAPTDTPYADVDSDGLTDVAIGRFPVRTAAELDAVIAKTLLYAQGNYARKLLKVSDRNDGINYEAHLSALDGVLGPSTVSTNISLGNYAANSSGIALARNDMVSAVNAGHSLLAYFGHGTPTSWATSLVTSSQVQAGLFGNASAPIVVWAMGCYGAYFTSPTQDSMAQQLMLQPNGGAAMVIGSTSLSYANSDIAWMRALNRQLRLHPVGEAMRLARNSLHLSGAHYGDITISGVLLGDPALMVR